MFSFILNYNNLINENFIFLFSLNQKNSISYKWNSISNSTFNHKQSIRSTGTPQQRTFHSVNKQQRGENHISRGHELVSQFYNMRIKDFMFLFYLFTASFFGVFFVFSCAFSLLVSRLKKLEARSLIVREILYKGSWRSSFKRIKIYFEDVKKEEMKSVALKLY